jgi:hypothetical protein
MQDQGTCELSMIRTNVERRTLNEGIGSTLEVGCSIVREFCRVHGPYG